MNTEEKKISHSGAHTISAQSLLSILPSGPVRWRRRVVCLSLRRPAGGRHQKTLRDWSTVVLAPFSPAMNCKNPHTFLLFLTASACAGMCMPPPWGGLVMLGRTLRTALPRRTRPPHRPNTASSWTV